MQKKEMVIQNNEIEQMQQYSIEEITRDLLSDIKVNEIKEKAIKIPISELSSLGASVASLLPCFRTVTETMTIDGTELYRVANQAAGDALRMAKDGTYYGSIKTASGSVKFAKFAQAGPISATTKAVTAINPATIMMAASLMAIEKELKDIKEMQKRIISFLEHGKEAQIENNIDVLGRILEEYKYNWDNDMVVSTKYDTACRIGQNATENIRLYKKDIRRIISRRNLYTSAPQLQIVSEQLQYAFKYYQMSLYTYAFASFLEIVLAGKFDEKAIINKKHHITQLCEEYSIDFTECNKYLEKLGGKLIIPNAFHAVGALDKTVGNALQKISLLEKTKLDKVFRKSGYALQDEGRGIKEGAIGQFAQYGNSGINMFVEKLDEVNHIYNHTKEIYFDTEQIYLIS